MLRVQFVDIAMAAKYNLRNKTQCIDVHEVQRGLRSNYQIPNARLLFLRAASKEKCRLNRFCFHGRVEYWT